MADSRGKREFYPIKKSEEGGKNKGGPEPSAVDGEMENKGRKQKLRKNL